MNVFQSFYNNLYSREIDTDINIQTEFIDSLSTVSSENEKWY